MEVERGTFVWRQEPFSAWLYSAHTQYSRRNVSAANVKVTLGTADSLIVPDETLCHLELQRRTRKTLCMRLFGCLLKVFCVRENKQLSNSLVRSSSQHKFLQKLKKDLIMVTVLSFLCS